MSQRYHLEHDWIGLVRLVAPCGAILRTRAKIAAGRPGSGVPGDTIAKETTRRLQALADRLNRMQECRA